MVPLIYNRPASIQLIGDKLVLSIRASNSYEKNFLIDRIQELANQTFNMILKIPNISKRELALLMLNEAKMVYLKNKNANAESFSQRLHEEPEQAPSSVSSKNCLVLSNVPGDFCTNMLSTPKTCSLEIVMIDPTATQTEEPFLLKPPKKIERKPIEKKEKAFEKNIKLISKVVIVLFVLLASLLSPTIRNIPLRIHEAIRRKTS